MSADLLRQLLESCVAGSVALILILLVRKPLRLGLGARAAYAFWALAPMAILATLVPAPAQQLHLLNYATANIGLPSATAAPSLIATAGSDPEQVLLSIWLLGSFAMLVLFVRRQVGFTRLVQRRADLPYDLVPGHGPAVAGFLRPRIVLPVDFLQRYNADEQALVLAHERLHLQRGDIHAQTLATVLRCLFWFNPLVHFAARRFRFDQELACDADVLASFANLRRTYADAMLKTQLADFGLPVGCHWQTSHPLKERIAMLKYPVPGGLRRKASQLMVMMMVATGAYGAWAAQPGTSVAADAKLIDVRFAISADGAPMTTPRVIVREGESFGLKIGEGKAALEFDFTARSLPEHQIELSGQVHRDGVLLASPSLRINEGQDSAMVKTNRDGSPLFDLHVTADITNNATAADAMKPASGPATPAAAMAANPDSLPPPRYPEEAIIKHIGGKVMLKVLVGVDGSVKDVRIHTSEPAGVFDKVALDAVSKWKFPNQPTEGWVMVPITFEPNDPPQRSVAK
jgi:TonB family protein